MLLRVVATSNKVGINVTARKGGTMPVKLGCNFYGIPTGSLGLPDTAKHVLTSDRKQKWSLLAPQ